MNKLFLILFCIPFCSLVAEELSFLRPPQYVGAPDSAHMYNNRAVTMVPSIAVSPGGRIWATWYAGVTPGEDHNNYIILATSGDGGQSWEEVLVVDPDFAGPVRAFDSEVWMAPDGNLYWTWAQAIGHDGAVSGVWAIQITNPEDGRPEYASPMRWTDGIMMCKPIVLSTGEWVLPVSTWRETDSSARMVVSVDDGDTWTVRGAAHVPKEDRNVDEHMIVERENGSLWLLCRTAYGIGESVSVDGGETWPDVAPSDIVHTNSRFYIYRLESGNLLLVKHGYIDEKTGRSHLRAFVSADDGKTWQGGLLLDERNWVTYPDGDQAADGTIYITYDYGRVGESEILYASFREEDALAGEDVSGRVKVKQLISKGSGGQRKGLQAQAQRNENLDGVTLDASSAGRLDQAHLSAVPFAVDELLFADRNYALKELPSALTGFSFLRVSMGGGKSYSCSRDGMVYFLTPQMNRNHDSQAKVLIDQGFSRVSLPEFQLFSGGAKQLVTLYQKYCQKGEVIEIGKWAIPLLGPEVN